MMEIIKRNKWKLLISSIIILLPALFGLIFWDRLPEQMTTHWGIDGQADGWGKRSFAVFVLPVTILIGHWFCILCTARDPKNRGQSGKVVSVIMWICPAVSFFASGIVYAAALGREMRADLVGILLIGLMFVVIGNYLPKCKQNYTIGIRVKWTLENEENWNATHRICGKIWVAGGLLIMACAFLPKAIVPWASIISMVVIAVIPVIYSYLYHRKQIKE